jgi:hypothetical protein
VAIHQQPRLSTAKIVQVIILDDGEIEYKTIESVFNNPYGANNI